MISLTTTQENYLGNSKLFLYHFRTCKKFGPQAWMIIAIIITEFLIVVKFDWKTISKPLPPHIAYFWILGLLLLIGWTIFKFYIYRDVKSDLPEKSETSNGNPEPIQKSQNNGNRELRSRSKVSKSN